MKDQYFGDVNDYRKYGLLRAMATAGLSIGVCWLLTANDKGNDGGLRRYLEQPSRWRKYDPDLFDRLQQLRQPNVERGVRRCAEWELVPGSTCFDEPLTDDSRQRDNYFSRAFRTLGECDVVFFDPDNGIEVPSTTLGKRNSSKYSRCSRRRAAAHSETVDSPICDIAVLG